MDFLQQQQQQQPSSLDGYSKVGLSQDHRPADNLFSHPSSSKTGFDDGPGPESLDHRFDDRLGPMLPAATSPDYRLSSLPMSFGEDTGDYLPAPPELVRRDSYLNFCLF